MNVPEIFKSVYSEAGRAAAINFVIFVTGIILFGAWLLKTSLGRKALSDSKPRRNNMPAYLPFVPLFIWGAFLLLTASAAEKFLPDMEDRQKAILDNLIFCSVEIITIMIIISLARASFAQRLKGFGLNLRTICKDIPAALLNLLTALPVITAMILLAMFLGRLIWGQDFEIQPHEKLDQIRAYSHLSVRVLIIFAAVVIAPVFEEMLFRGLFQTMLRSILLKPWPAIAISSAIFVLQHPENISHWPALFTLSLCMGYSYEKSGSLLRPIFIHALFNATSVIGTLYNI